MSWLLKEDTFTALNNEARDTVFTIGSGPVCTRGTRAEDGPDCFRAVYVSGLYTRAGYGLNYFMGAPDWLPLSVQADEKILPCVESSRQLDMRSGILLRTAIFENPGARVSLHEERFAALHDPFLMLQQVRVQIERAETGLQIVMGIDGNIRNHRAKYFKPGQMPNVDRRGVRLTEVIAADASAKGLHVLLRSPSTGRRAAAHGAVRQTAGPQLQCLYRAKDDRVETVFNIPAASSGQSFVFEKCVRLSADIPWPDGTPGHKADTALPAENGSLPAAQSYQQSKDMHIAAWETFWQTADIQIEGDEAAQQAARFAVWSTRICSPVNSGLSSVGAKNLSGDWYRGAVFWDFEMFQLPLLTALAPEQARNHIMYRYRRLPSARVLAAQDGYQGARFPWHSYSTGLEEPPVFGGFLYQQLHINAAVGWSVLHYYAMTHDRKLLLEAGLEILIELCRFWVSRMEQDEKGILHIRNVCGPDEVHQGIDDNAYTNRMVQVLLHETARLLDEAAHSDAAALQKIIAACQFAAEEPLKWRSAADGLHIPLIEKTGLLAQFAGFEKYPEPDAVLTEKQGHGADKTNKQADVLMTFQALPEMFDQKQLAAHLALYAPLGNHTSSLSMCSHALLAARAGNEYDAMKFFNMAAGVDLADSYGNTAHGIHGAGEGGIWQACVQGFGGLTVGTSNLLLRPMLPTAWKTLKYSFIFCGNRLNVAVYSAHFTLTNHGTTAVELLVPEKNGASKTITLQAGEELRIDWTAPWLPRRLEGIVIAQHHKLPDFIKTLRALRNDGIRMALTADSCAAEPVLQESGLTAYMDVLVDGSCVTQERPSPQCFYLAAQRLRCLPWNCLGIGFDSVTIEAIRSAGMTAVGIGEKTVDADLHLNVFDELTAEMLQAAIRNNHNPVNPYLAGNIEKLRTEAA